MAKNSIKAREKLADSLMAMQASLFVNLSSIVLVAPIGFFGLVMFKGEPIDLRILLEPHAKKAMLVAVAFYVASLGVGMMARASAAKIYNELYPDA
ncbi:hypothetical protein ACFQS6_04100 [Xanthomonas populi]|uniref:Uncharacterized protein n=1 Tax=Xanthomonas populi TaxID=53414 RepID=A0A2S7ESP6_9XANT|nr:hypothetical protein [Xanthomonas populi]PPU96104.1 hypothetical protein XpopCFBP1817_07290 [Xanthomonas populi]